MNKLALFDNFKEGFLCDPAKVRRKNRKLVVEEALFV